MVAIAVSLLLLCFHVTHGSSVNHVTDHEQFKKLLKTRTNVLAHFNNQEPGSDEHATTMEVLEAVARAMDGKATIAFVDCLTKQGLKICKKLKGLPDENEPFKLLHYNRGDFHKEYDRSFSVKSMTRFLEDPKGSLPFSEDPKASKYIFHVEKSEQLKKLREDEAPLFVMFYAPWCGYCQKMKPDFSAAADKLMNSVRFAAVDMTLAGNKVLSKQLNIRGFPTMFLFEGEEQTKYSGDRTADAFVKWLQVPEQTDPEPPKKDDLWSASEVALLTDASFEEFIDKKASVLVMFYASWCGFCKKVVPEFEKAAKILKERDMDGVLAAIDVTQHTSIGSKYEVSSYPTFKYFSKGKLAYQVDLRTADTLIEFMEKPSPPAPAPPPAVPWNEEASDVIHLTDDNVKSKLAEFKVALVVFYAPWCTWCQAVKPEVQIAAKRFAGSTDVAICAMDCTVHKQSCTEFGIASYPTILIFRSDGDQKPFSGKRTADNFVQLIEDAIFEKEAKGGKPPLLADPKIGRANAENWNELLAGGHRLVLFHSPTCCDSIRQVYEEVATVLRDGSLVAVNCEESPDLCASQNATDLPTLRLYKDGVFVRIEKQHTIAAIVSAVSGAPAPPEFELSSSVKNANYLNYNELVAVEQRSLVMFYAPWCSHCQRAKPEFNKAADTYALGNFVAIDCDVFQAFCRQEGVNGFPTFRIYEAGRFLGNYRGQYQAQSFIDSFSSPVSKFVKTEDGKFLFPEEVKVATASSFEDLVKGNERSLVMFYAPWCGHCKMAKPEFIKAASNYPEGKFVAVDCTTDHSLCRGQGVGGYPSFRIFQDGKFLGVFNGPRTADEFIEAIKPKIVTATVPKKPSHEHIEL